MRGAWPLVGRDEDLRHLEALVQSDATRGAVVAGAAGVGKTRLALECLDRLERAGFVTVRVTATEAARGLPFGALAPLLPAAEAASGVTEDRGEYLRRCCAVFAERAGDRQLLVFVDDAHLLDPASAVLVHQVAATRSALVLVTVRTGESVPDPIRSLWKDGLAERIDLAGLGPGAVEELLERVLGGPVDRGAVARLAAHSQGNVLVLHELVAGCLASGALRTEGGLWCLGRLSLSDRLVEIVEARLAGLTDDERALVELIALGEPVGGELSTLGDGTVAESLERQGLLGSVMSGRRLEVRLAHPVYGEVLRARLPAVRARRLARRLADAVEDAGARRREDVLRVATWRLQAGAGARAGLMLAAAYQARVAWDLPLSERLAQAAHTAGAGFDAALLIGHLACMTGRPREAEQRFAELERNAGDDRRRSVLAEARTDNLVWGLGRTGEAIAIAQAAEGTIADRALREAVMAKRGAWLQVGGRPAEAVALLEPLAERAEGRTLVNIAQHLAIPLLSMGRISDALSVGARGLKAHRLLEGSPLAWGPYVHPALDCLALDYGGFLLDAEERGAAGYDQAVAEASIEAQALFAVVLGHILVARGRLERAARLARESVTIYRQMHWRQMVRMASVPLATALALAGRVEEAQGALAELDTLGLPDTDWPGPGLWRARAWTAAASGDLTTARCVLENGSALARECGERVQEGVLLHDLARLGRPAAVVVRLGELASLVEGPLAPAQARHAEALAAGDAPALEAVSSDFETMGADLLAAEAAADAAVAYRRAGQARMVTRAQRRAAALARRCQGAATPALGAVDVRSRLTPAEREVALLAAGGRSNREIADQLHLSLRTVENYLHRSYEKLGISGRAALAAALVG